MSVSVEATYFHSLRDAHGQRFATSWAALCRKLSCPRVAAEKESVPGLSLATFRGDRRCLDNVELVYAVTLDLDEAVDWPTLIGLFDDKDAFVHTTYSSRENDVRARAFLPLSRPVVAEEYRRCWQAVADRCRTFGLVLDPNPKDPSRFWYLPSIPPGGKYAFSVGRGKPINVDWCLAQVPPPAPPTPPAPPSGPVGDVEARAAAYLERCPPAISGQGGHNTTFLVAQRLVRGFMLDEETAYRLLWVWNQSCDPPWNERELRRKIRQAARRGTMAEGSMLDRRRAS